MTYFTNLDVAHIIDTIGAWVSGMTTMVVATLQGFIPLFYTVSTTVDTVGSLTVFGVLGLMSIAIGLVYLGLNFAKSFFLR